MHELSANMHIHTTYSDGSGSHEDVAQAALKTDLDVLLISDHNVLVQGAEGYYYKKGRKRVLLLIGEEIHDQDRDPQKNHLLVFGASRELANLADDPQTLIEAAHNSGGMCFIAHPVDRALPAFAEADISWVDWDVVGFNGIELWNGFSELKTVVKGKIDGFFYAYFPEFIGQGPAPEAVRIWDNLLASGQRIVAIGGSDAHARKMSLGPLHKVIFPYEFHFSSVNTHLLTPSALVGDLNQDRILIYDALAFGHCFVGYDLPSSTRGFRFSAVGKNESVIMGDEIDLHGSVTMQVKLPLRADIRLLKDGKIILRTLATAVTHVAAKPGIYRVEVYKQYLGKPRGWIFSNPIYVR